MKKLNANILIVEDDEHVVVTSKMILKQYFESIDSISTPKTLESALRLKEYDVILLDMNFEAGVTTGNEGLYWMNRIRSISPQSQIVLHTAYGDIELAVKSMREGAVDFLPKPWEKEKLVSTIRNAFTLSRSKKENKEKITGDGIVFIAESSAMKKIKEAVEQVASTDANILILGENGTGKEVVARSIHSQSTRRKDPFVAVDLGAIPHSIFESEMFGYEKGAFTDAKESKPGKFEIAHKGTLFLDEIGNLPFEMQVKLLSVIQNHSCSRVGSNKMSAVDTRLICATNAPLHHLVKDGKFRQDLYYRIRTIEIVLPPLRDRKEDIPLLLDHYLKEFNQRYKKKSKLDNVTLRGLLNYHWPGNIRELQHAVERAVILGKTEVLSMDDFQLTPMLTGDVEVERPSLNLSAMEKELIKKALDKCSGNLTKASEELGIGRSTLYRKMEEYGIKAL
jgi:two-component system, NtrC family, response regulator HydG